MQIFVTLGGHSIPWTFHASTPFWQWAHARPWTSGGGFAVMWSSGPNACEALAEALPGAVHGADAGASRSEIFTMDPAALGRSLFEALAEALGFAPSQRPRELAARLAPELGRRTVIVAGQLSAPLEAQQAVAASELLDHLSKLPDPAPLTIVLFAHGEGAVGAPLNFDFRTGMPVESVLAHLDEADITRCWGAYLHYRLAWEAAGNLERTADFAQSPSLASLPGRVGDDDALERALGAYADRSFAALDELTRVAWQAYASGSAGLPTSATGMWRPTPGDDPRPEPWLARALLRAGAGGAVRWRLRGCLNCRSLATGLLGRCLELETRLHAAHGEILLRFLPEEEAQENFRRYQNGGSPQLAYSPDHPAPPNRPEDVWLFATMGAVVRCLKPRINANVTQRYWELVALRNGVAHGGHVGWIQWKSLRRLSGLNI